MKNIFNYYTQSEIYIVDFFNISLKTFLYFFKLQLTVLLSILIGLVCIFLH